MSNMFVELVGAQVDYSNVSHINYWWQSIALILHNTLITITEFVWRFCNQIYENYKLCERNMVPVIHTWLKLHQGLLEIKKNLYEKLLLRISYYLLSDFQNSHDHPVSLSLNSSGIELFVDRWDVTIYYYFFNWKITANEANNFA